MSDPECTDCGGTGLAYQTERRCSCQTLLQRLRQYEGQSFETTACYNGLRDEAAATIERLTKENAELKASGRQAIDAGEVIIERLTKELEEARLQDHNRWRREYWKHYNDLKARADSLAAELAKATKENESLTTDVAEAKGITKVIEARADSLAAELAKAREALTRGNKLVRAFLRCFNPNDMPEDQAQQWQQLEHWCAALPATQTLDQYEAKLKKWEQENREATLSHVIAGMKCQCDFPVARCDDKGCYCTMCGKLA